MIYRIDVEGLMAFCTNGSQVDSTIRELINRGAQLSSINISVYSNMAEAQQGRRATYQGSINELR